MIPLRHDRPPDQHLAWLPHLDVPPLVVNQTRRVVRDQARHAAAGVLLAVGQQGDATRRLAEAPRLEDHGLAAAQLPARGELQVFAERRGAADGVLERGELVGDGGVLGDGEVDGRDGEEGRDLVFRIVREELRKVELGHPVDDAAHVEGVDEVALDAGDVRGRQVRERAVGEGRVVLRVPRLPRVERGDALGEDVGVGELDAFGQAGRAAGVDEDDEAVGELGGVGDALPVERLLAEDVGAVGDAVQGIFAAVGDDEDAGGREADVFCGGDGDDFCVFVADQQVAIALPELPREVSGCSGWTGGRKHSPRGHDTVECDW